MQETETLSDVPPPQDVPPDDEQPSETPEPIDVSTSDSFAMEVTISEEPMVEIATSDPVVPQEPPPPQVKIEPSLVASIEKSIAMISEERRESCDTGYSSLENGECKLSEEHSFSVAIRDVLKNPPTFPVPEKLPSDKKGGRGRPRKNINNNNSKKETAKNNKKAEKEKSNQEEDKEKETDEPRRSTRLKSKTDNTVRMEDLLNSININEIVKTIEENSFKSNGCDIPSALSSTSVASAAADPNNENNSTGTSENAETRPPFKPIYENEYFTERSISKDAERMICDCILTKEEIIRGEKGCGDDCLNRLLLIECCSRCTLGERCSNKRFQKREYAKCEAFKTKKKGYGLRVLEDIPSGTFIMEYVGEVIDSDEFEHRAMEYARGKIPHFYFMSLKSDCIIDATVKGNISRFINHSCEPNAETQKWTVQGELRIGFFSKRDISAGEEVTFDYQLQRYGKQAQRCYCETPSCTGWIGEDPEKQPTDDVKKKERKKKKANAYQDWETALDEICQVGLINRHQTLSLNRLMVHAKELPVRMQILQLIEEGHPACRRLFVDYHGLPIIWSWMVDCTPEQDELKTQLLKTLFALPITNKTVLIDSKVLPLVEQWAFAVDQKTPSEQLSAQSVLESVEDIASADETPVSEMAQKVLEVWSSLREMYRIPKKERIQQMKEHEREADQNIVKPRPKRVPLYVENMRDRYHRNRHNKDKDFDKIFFDRMKDYDKSGNQNHSFDKRKRRSSPDRRNFDRNRKFDGAPNKLSKMEHRFLFEMKYREKERKEEQNYWYQNAAAASLYYANQQHVANMSNLINSAAQYMASVPPPNYGTENVYQPIPTVPPPATPTNNFFSTPPPNMYQNVVLPPTHIPPPSLPPSVQSQVSPAPVSSAQPYYPNQVHVPSYPPPTPVSYPMRATASTTITDAKPIPTTCQLRASPAMANNSYDYPGLTIDDIPVPGDLRNRDLASPATASTTSNTSSTRAAGNAPVREINPVNIDINNLKLPPKWKTARDSEGRLYYYHKETRVSQWYPPKWEEPEEEEEEEEEIEVTDEESSSESESTEEEEEIPSPAYDEIEQETDQETLESVMASLDEQNPEDEAEINQDIEEQIEETIAAEENEDDATEDAAADDESVLQESNLIEEEPIIDTPTGIPLVTLYTISPREPIDEEERIRNKLRRRYLKEKMRKRKKEKMLKNGLLNGHKNGSRSSKSKHRSDHMNGDSSSLSAAADTSEMSEEKRKDSFRFHMAKFIVTCLNPYFRSSCTQARITNNNDFKHLAKKLTHFVMLKELKHCQNVTDLACNASVKYKAKEYVRKYMARFDEVYVRPLDDGSY